VEHGLWGWPATREKHACLPNITYLCFGYTTARPCTSSWFSHTFLSLSLTFCNASSEYPLHICVLHFVSLNMLLVVFILHLSLSQQSFKQTSSMTLYRKLIKWKLSGSLAFWLYITLHFLFTVSCIFEPQVELFFQRTVNFLFLKFCLLLLWLPIILYSCPVTNVWF